jgi:hypothetical protein
MMSKHSTRGWVGGFVAALLVFAAAATPGSAPAMRGSGDLSPRLAKLSGASLRGAAPAAQAKALGLAPDGLARRGRRLLVDVRFAGGALAARDELREAGAGIVAVSRRYQTLTVATDPARLRAIAAGPGVEGVTPVFAPVATAATCPSGSIVSEGDVQLEAKAAREAPPEPDGAGVTVGILSDSFAQASESGEGGPIATEAKDDVESGDLPGANGCLDASTTPVEVLPGEDGPSDASDEGRAMAQIVHDLAPGATLKFATAFTSEISFAKNIRALAGAGAEVIVDDVFWQGEPFFQDGPIAVAVREVVEDGATYFSAAGNNNLLDGEGHDIASWETPIYRDAESCPPAIQAIPGANAVHCLDFNPDPAAVDRTFGIKVKAGATLALDLQWAEPWNGVGTDLDAYLLDSAGNRIPGAESHEDNVEISQKPVEVLEWPNSSSSTKTVQLVVNRFSGGTPRVKFALIQNGGGVSGTEYPRSSDEDTVGPTIFGHSGSAEAISMAAVRSITKSFPEPYSSRGPVRHDFGPVEDDTPAAPLLSPEMLSKPDLTATDCVRTTFFSFFDESIFPIPGWYFCGTSAAAPHAAAVAALMREAEPAAGPEEIREALVGSAAPTFQLQYGPCDVGAGLVEAVGAIDEVLAETGAAGPPCETPESEVEPEEAAAPGDWGSEVPPAPPVVSPTTSPPTPQPDTEEPKPVLPPRTFFLQRPAKIIRTQARGARAVFLFGSNEAGVSFVCRIDGGLFRPCRERLARRFPLGWHTIRVAARDAAGNGDKTPARYRFKVKRVR